MNLRFGGIVHGDEERWPGHASSVLYLAGCPFRCPWCNTPSLVQTEGFAEQSVEYFLNELSKSEAVVLTGGEPLMQGNAVLGLLQRLDAPVRIETNGYYSETLNDCLPLAKEVQLDLKARLDARTYAEATAFRGDPELLLSNVLRSLTFLEKNGSRVRKVFSFTVVPGVNDSPETARELAKYVSLYCDEFVLRSFDPSDCLDASFKERPAPASDKMTELLKEVQGRVRKAVVL
ncbi:hypothetical protein COX85_02185 [Candidatus Micrarchaeota archaeon CG_4_10_14_0_2_um_filter_55_9]|nr:MAG: hypothetical protein AUJ15_01165 [Candidatus Micrarchaeota archaeon CG1_02_55_41]PIO03060.1 MAG: hypothetical protein COT57_01140 [Candidatus Micrarchaeota archaeon CG09_land_8_20_14_0_10_55_25]PIZ91752.1 MAG: hypothetical protein COX85_02185 [Candidatus Micrarchaeota archaeon CG_4_10_14_0_2_um_filter_55_9]PJD00889.1 MAG: hypothetical protein COU38_03930 [Candidatus Micrarchaeota archaeon CG10_big_fil_rev_8_21_14_0_10_54_18]